MFNGQMTYAPPPPPGKAQRVLALVAKASDPTLRTQHRWPFWVRHPLLFALIVGPVKFVCLILTLVLFRFPRFTAPLIAAGFLWAIAGIAGHFHGGTNTVAVLALTAGIPAWWYAGYPFGRNTLIRTYDWMRYGVIATWIIGAVLTIAATTAQYRGFLGSGWCAFPLWAIIAGFSTGWWIDPGRGTKPEPEVPAVDDRLLVWASRCAAEDRRLAGTGLRDLKWLPSVKGAWMATIDGSPTEFDTAQLCASAGYIAARLGLPPTSVVVQPHPSCRNDWAQLMVFPINPLQAVQRFTQLSLDKLTGWITIGIHADGTPARWRLWVPGWGACHGLIFGTTGAGKSGLLSVLFTECRNSRLVCTFFGDPAMGESAPDWQEHVTAFAGTFPRICEMLQGVERMMDERRSRRRRTRWQDVRGYWHRGAGKFTPTEDDPLLLVAIDEFSDLAKDPVYGPECLRIIARICKQGRKFGVAVILLTQIPSLEEMGDSQAIRSMASGMNIAAFRTSDSMSAMMGLPMSLPIDPVDLPAMWPDKTLTAGLGYLCRSDSPASPMRGLWVEEEETIVWANSGDPVGVPEYLLAAGGRFFETWLPLLDVDDEDVLLLDLSGAPVRAGDGASLTDPEGAGEVAGKGTIWERLKTFLAKSENAIGATTKMLAEATGADQKAVAVTLRRYSTEKYGSACHEVPDRDGVWRLGPLPAGAVDPDDDGRDDELVAQNPTYHADRWSAANDPMTSPEPELAAASSM